MMLIRVLLPFERVTMARSVKLYVFFLFDNQNTIVLISVNIAEPSDVSPGGVSSYARL
jgi:hypothetical protein